MGCTLSAARGHGVLFKVYWPKGHQYSYVMAADVGHFFTPSRHFKLNNTTVTILNSFCLVPDKTSKRSSIFIGLCVQHVFARLRLGLVYFSKYIFCYLDYVI